MERFAIGNPGDDLGDPTAFGLIGMEERARRLGGRLTIAPVPEGGTSMRAVLPLDP